MLARREILDHGFVELVDKMGNDVAVVDAARVSISSLEVKAVASDRQLIRYLLRHIHTSPFEQCTLKFRAKMPLFVARQWVRHRTAAINEMSARYGVLPEEFYIPQLEDIQVQSKNNKQGRGEALPQEEAECIRRIFETESSDAYAVYQDLLSKGTARELARAVLPVNIYTQWYWTINLWNLMHFLRLRMDAHSQKEIRVYADAMYEMVKDYFPICMEAFDDYILHSVKFSRMEIGLLRELFGPEIKLFLAHVTQDPSYREKLEKQIGSKRELIEFIQKLEA